MHGDIETRDLKLRRKEINCGDKTKRQVVMINDKILLYSIGNYIQYPGINHNGKEYKNMKKKNAYIYIYITESLCCITDIGTTL